MIKKKSIPFLVILSSFLLLGCGTTQSNSRSLPSGEIAELNNVDRLLEEGEHAKSFKFLRDYAKERAEENPKWDGVNEALKETFHTIRKLEFVIKNNE